MSLDSLIAYKVFSNSFLPILTEKDLMTLCRVKKTRKYAIKEIFKRVNYTAIQYQTRLFFYNLQLGRVLPLAQTILELFKTNCNGNEHPSIKSLAHNSRVLCDNSNEKLIHILNNNEAILSCLAQNINNGIKLFYPEKIDFDPLCSRTPVEDFRDYTIKHGSETKDSDFQAIRFAQEFYWMKGKISKEKQEFFEKHLRDLTNSQVRPHKDLLKIPLTYLITCLYSADEDKAQSSVISSILNTLSHFAEDLPQPHILGLIHYMLNSSFRIYSPILQFAKYVPENCRRRLMEERISLMRHNEPDVTNIDIIGHLSTWLTENQITKVLDYLSEFIYKNKKSLSFYTVLQTYVRVAAQSQHRDSIFERLLEDWTIKCLQQEDKQDVGLFVLEQMAKEGWNLSLYKDKLLRPVLGCILEKSPWSTKVRESVIRLIGNLAPGLADNDFDVVVNELHCLRPHQYPPYSSGYLIQIVGTLITAKKQLIDVLLPILFKAIKNFSNVTNESTTLPGDLVVESQMLSHMSNKQLYKWIVELHSWVKDDYKKYYLQVLVILSEIHAQGNDKLKKYVKTLFGQDLLSELYTTFQVHREFIDYCHGRSDKTEHKNDQIDEMSRWFRANRKRKKIIKVYKHEFGSYK